MQILIKSMIFTSSLESDDFKLLVEEVLSDSALKMDLSWCQNFVQFYYLSHLIQLNFTMEELTRYLIKCRNYHLLNGTSQFY